MGRFVEEENGDAVREAKVLHASSCANHSDEPLRAKIVFSNGFHVFCVSSPLHKIEACRTFASLTAVHWLVAQT